MPHRQVCLSARRADRCRARCGVPVAPRPHLPRRRLSGQYRQPPAFAIFRDQACRHNYQPVPRALRHESLRLHTMRPRNVTTLSIPWQASLHDQAAPRPAWATHPAKYRSSRTANPTAARPDGRFRRGPGQGFRERPAVRQCPSQHNAPATAASNREDKTSPSCAPTNAASSRPLLLRHPEYWRKRQPGVRYGRPAPPFPFQYALVRNPKRRPTSRR